MWFQLSILTAELTTRTRNVLATKVLSLLESVAGTLLTVAKIKPLFNSQGQAWHRKMSFRFCLKGAHSDAHLTVRRNIPGERRNVRLQDVFRINAY